MPSVFSRLSLEQSSNGNWNNPEVGEGWDSLLVNSWGLLERADYVFIVFISYLVNIEQ